MKQKIVKTVGALTNLGADIIGGLNLLETDLHIVHVPKLKVEVDLLALLTGNDSFQSGRLLLRERRDALDSIVGKAEHMHDDMVKQAKLLTGAVADAMASAREASDALELKVSDDMWPLPKYREMLFPV